MALIMKNTVKKQITDILVKYGFTIIDFDFKEINETHFEIRYKKMTDYFFKAERIINFCPGIGLSKITAIDRVFIFEKVLENVGLWAKLLKEELEIGNPWESIKNDLDNTDFSSYELLFTEKEVNIIDQKLDTILIKLKEIGISDSEIEEDIKHLKESSRKISMKDWKLLLIGSISSWFLSGLISSEHVNSIWQIIKTSFLKILP